MPSPELKVRSNLRNHSDLLRRTGIMQRLRTRTRERHAPDEDVMHYSSRNSTKNVPLVRILMPKPKVHQNSRFIHLDGIIMQLPHTRKLVRMHELQRGPPDQLLRLKSEEVDNRVCHVQPSCLLREIDDTNERHAGCTGTRSGVGWPGHGASNRGR